MIRHLSTVTARGQRRRVPRSLHEPRASGRGGTKVPLVGRPAPSDPVPLVSAGRLLGTPSSATPPVSGSLGGRGLNRDVRR